MENSNEVKNAGLEEKVLSKGDGKDTQKMVTELKAKYRDVYAMELNLEPDDETRLQLKYYFKKPQIASYDRYVKSVSKSPTKANRAFILDNVVDEQREELTSALEKYPAIALSAADKLLAMLGLGSETNLQKL